jgi:aminoglycoside phosphotransferase (APT) family kinase protein
VLRAKPAGHLLKSAHLVDREFRVMKALAGSGVPVPNVLYLSGGHADRPHVLRHGFSTAASSGSALPGSSTMPAAPQSTTP